MKLYLTVEGDNVKRVYVHRQSASEDAERHKLQLLEVHADMAVESFDFEHGLVDMRLFGSVDETHLRGTTRVIPDKPHEPSHTDSHRSTGDEHDDEDEGPG